MKFTYTHEMDKYDDAVVSIFLHGLRVLRSEAKFARHINVDSSMEACKVGKTVDAKAETLGKFPVVLDRWRECSIALSKQEQERALVDVQHNLHIREHVRILVEDMGAAVFNTYAHVVGGRQRSAARALRYAGHVLGSRGVPARPRFAAIGTDALEACLRAGVDVFADRKVPAFIQQGAPSILAHRDAFTVASRPVRRTKSEKAAGDMLLQAQDQYSGLVIGMLVAPLDNDLTRYTWRVLYGIHCEPSHAYPIEILHDAERDEG